MGDYILNFVEAETNAPIATLAGRDANFLIQHSDLVKSLLEINASQRILTIPVGMPHGRMEIFKKILRKEPVGRYVLENRRKVVKWNPLSKEEERLIVNELGNGLSDDLLQSERERVLHTVLHYLMLDPSVEEKFLRIENLNNSNKETRRRNKITRKRIMNKEVNLATRNPNEYQNNIYDLQDEAARVTVPFLNEDKIENLVEKHKNLIYGTYARRNRNQLEKRMTAKNIANRNRRVETLQREQQERIARLERELERAYQHMNRFHRADPNNNNWVNAEDQIFALQEELENERRNLYPQYEGGPFNTNLLMEINLAPFRNKNLKKMSDIEFERYLRSLRKEGEEKTLPYQGPLVGNFYGNQNL